MLQYFDKDRSQNILHYRKKNFWYFNNYARLDGIDNQRFVCAGIAYNSIRFGFDRFGFDKEKFKEDKFKSLIDGYSKTATEIYLGQKNIDSQSYKEGGFCFPYGWEYGAFALNVLHFYLEDLEYLENSDNRGYVTIKAYLENRATEDKPYLLPDLEQVAKAKILDLWSYNGLRKEGKDCMKDFFSFHLQKYKGSISEFMRYVWSFMMQICLEDTFDNVRLFAEFKAWHDEKSKELGFTTNQLPFTANGNPTTFATVENKNLILSQREIALIYHYEEWLLTDTNCNDEVSKYFKKDGTSHRSGKALMDDYRIVNGRIKDWLNQKNTIQNLEKIIPLLKNTNGISDARRDLEQAIKNRESLF